MSWWSWLRGELRSLVLGEYPPRDPALAELFGSGPTASGEPVSVQRAAGLPVVWRCVSLIAGTVGSLPLTLYRRLEDGSREKYASHPLYGILHDRPNPYVAATTFWEAFTTALLLRGNAYAAVSRDGDGRVRGLWFINPDRVQVEPLKNGRVRYRVTNPDGTQTLVNDMVHAVGPLSDDGITGRSVIAAARESLGTALAERQYVGELFHNGMSPRGVLTTDGRLSDVARTNLRTALEETHVRRGRRHRTLILEEGLKFQPIALTHEDAELIEQRKFSAAELCQLFGVPPHLAGLDYKSSVYSNAVHEGLHFLKFTLQPWLRRIEAAVELACISPLGRNLQYVEFNTDALLSVDTKTRYEAYEIALRAGILTADEVRRKENLPSLAERSA